MKKKVTILMYLILMSLCAYGQYSESYLMPRQDNETFVEYPVNYTRVNQQNKLFFTVMNEIGPTLLYIEYGSNGQVINGPVQVINHLHNSFRHIADAELKSCIEYNDYYIILGRNHYDNKGAFLALIQKRTSGDLWLVDVLTIEYILNIEQLIQTSNGIKFVGTGCHEKALQEGDIMINSGVMTILDTRDFAPQNIFISDVLSVGKPIEYEGNIYYTVVLEDAFAIENDRSNLLLVKSDIYSNDFDFYVVGGIVHQGQAPSLQISQHLLNGTVGDEHFTFGTLNTERTDGIGIDIVQMPTNLLNANLLVYESQTNASLNDIITETSFRDCSIHEGNDGLEYFVVGLNQFLPPRVCDRDIYSKNLFVTGQLNNANGGLFETRRNPKFKTYVKNIFSNTISSGIEVISSHSKAANSNQDAQEYISLSKVYNVELDQVLCVQRTLDVTYSLSSRNSLWHSNGSHREYLISSNHTLGGRRTYNGELSTEHCPADGCSAYFIWEFTEDDCIEITDLSVPSNGATITHRSWRIVQIGNGVELFSGEDICDFFEEGQLEDSRTYKFELTIQDSEGCTDIFTENVGTQNREITCCSFTGCDFNANPAFSLSSICVDGSWLATFTGTSYSGITHTWELWEVNNQGSTNGGTFVADLGSDATGWTPSLDLAKRYYILHRMEGLCIGTLELAHPIIPLYTDPDLVTETEDGLPEVTFCLGEDIWVNGSASLHEDRYHYFVYKIDNSGNLNWFGGLPTQYGEAGRLNLSERFANQSPAKYFDQGSYRIFLGTSHPDLCLVFTLTHQDIEVVCKESCYDLSFRLDSKIGQQTFDLSSEKNVSYNHPDVVSSWYILTTNPNGRIDLAHYEEGDLDANMLDCEEKYTVVHQMTTPCGSFCYALELGPHYCAEPSVIHLPDFDCDILDEFDCGITAPTNVTIENGVMTWDPVPGAVGYIVQTDLSGYDFPVPQCECPRPAYMRDVYVEENLWIVELEGCFYYRVIAVCANGEESVSGVYCSQTLLEPKARHETTSSIYPNPSMDEIFIEFNNISEVTSVEITDLTGNLLYQQPINGNTYTKSIKSTVRMSVGKFLSPGLYLVKVNAGTDSQVHKLMIL